MDESCRDATAPCVGDYYFVETFLRQQGDYSAVLAIDALLVDSTPSDPDVQRRVLEILNQLMRDA